LHPQKLREFGNAYGLKLCNLHESFGRKRRTI
jgi:hypothetical protein